MQPIIVSPVRVSYADYRRLYFRQYSRTQFWLLFPVLIILGLIFALSRVRLLATPWFYGPPLLLVAGSAVVVGVGYLNRIRAAYEAAGLATAALSYRFDLNRFTVSGAGEAALEVPWSAVQEARRCGFWLLLTTAAATHLVDLRQVQAPASEAALLDLLRIKGVEVK